MTKGKGNNIIKVAEVVSLIKEEKTSVQEELCITYHYFPKFLCM